MPFGVDDDHRRAQSMLLVELADETSVRSFRPCQISGQNEEELLEKFDLIDEIDVDYDLEDELDKKLAV